MRRLTRTVRSSSGPRPARFVLVLATVAVATGLSACSHDDGAAKYEAFTELNAQRGNHGTDLLNDRYNVDGYADLWCDGTTQPGELTSFAKYNHRAGMPYEESLDWALVVLDTHCPKSRYLAFEAGQMLDVTPSPRHP